MKAERANVPCGTCHLCCLNEFLILLPDEGDDVSSYQHKVVDVPGAGRVPVLERKTNGECIYLESEGCTIHDRAPFICRVFDCRRWFLNHSRSERRAMVKTGVASKKVFEAGRERLSSLVESAL